MNSCIKTYDFAQEQTKGIAFYRLQMVEIRSLLIKKQMPPVSTEKFDLLPKELIATG